MIVVHHLENSRSQRVLWLLEELSLPYRVERYARDPATGLAPRTLKSVHPLGKSPVIVDEDAGLTLAETGAIVEYLVDKAGALGPGDDPQTARRYRFWLHYAEGSLMPPLLVRLVLSRIPVMGRIALRRVQPLIDVHLDHVEAELSQRPWFAGETLTAADVMMSFPLEAAAARNGLDGRRATGAWLSRIHARPAYDAALRAGGPYDYA
ncbi:glutathione S-transferase family protein [Palleronia rufa]|uniref:glutathione S-transferase family protein n=1 Tax=Palleronia rufa TaxID=1530186 RepID=UPI0005674666|nr:glutathione S-transferase [Palleronia rufa]